MLNKERKGKWQPFDALEGHRKHLKEAEYESGKQTKPILFSDEIESLNYILVNAYQNKLEIRIYYYNNGYINEVSGIISKIDTINKLLILDKLKINLNMVIKVEEI